MAFQSRFSEAIGLLAWFAVVFAAAAIGALASIEAKTFYAQLTQPAWAPPGYVFGPVWSVLYALMGLSACMIWRQRREKKVATALILFVVQLCANALWSWLFFVWHSGAWAFVDVLALLALIATVIGAFWSVHRLAAVLMLPYFAWVCFASMLTWAVWQRNPGIL